MEYQLQAIGHYKSKQVHPYEAGRQPDPTHQQGLIELAPGHNFEQALIGLEKGQMIWVLFIFHHNQNWKPMVLPPRGGNQKVGVFATRSPYRPNQIGMSAVRVLDIQGLKIFVEGADLLDQTPIVDIKPYLSYADSHEGETPAWLKNTPHFEVNWSPQAEKHWDFLQDKVPNLRSFILHQLEYEPTNSLKKRVQSLGTDLFILSYRTWRVAFKMNDLSVEVLKIFSGYSEQEIQIKEDPYQDKELHRQFNQTFKPS